MTREEIREGIVDWFLMRDPSKDRSWAEWEVKVLFNKLDSAGLVIKVDRVLDDDYFDGLEGLAGDRIKQAGYEAVKPLIEDKVQRIREANFR